MKVLYIGHYKEASGWGQVARDYILALDRVGVNVVPRAIELGNARAELSKELQKLENKSDKNCDICIQHILPNYMIYDSHFSRNIGIFELETSHIKNTPWPHHLNLMDEIWVPCRSMVKDAHINGIVKPVKLVPHTFDTSIYDVQYPRLNLPTHNNFCFYTICEFNKRKHLSALIKAFHTEFNSSEPVLLIIKVNKYGMSGDRLAEELKNFCNGVKNALRLYQDPQRYKPEIIITIDIPREDLLRLHSTCDCFVAPSYGETWSIPAYEAMALGKIVIASATGGMMDYIDSERNGFLVGGSMEPVFGQFDTIPHFGTARERWFEISTSQLMQTMRRVYEMDKETKNRISMEAKMSAKKYDYSQIGKVMKDLIVCEK